MKSLIFGLVAIGLLTATLVGKRQADHEPVYNGQPLSRWIDDCGFVWWSNRHIFNDGNSAEFLHSKEGNAKLALRSAGEKALPYLIRDLHEHDSPFVTLYYAVLVRVPFQLTELLPHPNIAAQKKTSAAIALQAIGPAFVAAIPDLLKLLTDDDAEVRTAAQETLRIIRAE
ncbi:MAG: hypothetical protein ABI651_15635 [Verrucomicrobiota bacterium]